MSNKLKKKITCCLCEKTVKLTDDCQKLIQGDVCPKCAGMVARIVNNMLEEINEEKLKEEVNE